MCGFVFDFFNIIANIQLNACIEINFYYVQLAQSLNSLFWHRMFYNPLICAG